MKLVELTRFSTRIEADLARLTLEAEGIEAVILDAEMQYLFGQIRLMVLEDDLAESRAVLGRP